MTDVYSLQILNIYYMAFFMTFDTDYIIKLHWSKNSVIFQFWKWIVICTGLPLKVVDDAMWISVGDEKESQAVTCAIILKQWKSCLSSGRKLGTVEGCEPGIVAWPGLLVWLFSMELLLTDRKTMYGTILVTSAMDCGFQWSHKFYTINITLK